MHVRLLLLLLTLDVSSRCAFLPDSQGPIKGTEFGSTLSMNNDNTRQWRVFADGTPVGTIARIEERSPTEVSVGLWIHLHEMERLCPATSKLHGCRLAFFTRGVWRHPVRLLSFRCNASIGSQTSCWIGARRDDAWMLLNADSSEELGRWRADDFEAFVAALHAVGPAPALRAGMTWSAPALPWNFGLNGPLGVGHVGINAPAGGAVNLEYKVETAAWTNRHGVASPALRMVSGDSASVVWIEPSTGELLQWEGSVAGARVLVIREDAWESAAPASHRPASRQASLATDDRHAT